MAYWRFHRFLRTAIVAIVIWAFGSAAIAAEPGPIGRAENVSTDIFDDPFANESALNEEQLRSSRGGFAAAGFLIEFAVIFTLQDGTLATLASDPQAFIEGIQDQGFGHEFPLTSDEFLSLQHGVTTTVFENTLNNALVVQNISLNLLISNYTQQITIGSAAVMDARLLSQAAMSGF